ncbi:MAG: RNA polymerase sigma factor [Myxococcales bacterium]|nr:RNA polymerase sigma factor [Myxococcales bacterium]
MTRALRGDAEAYRLLLVELYDVADAYVRRILGSSPLVEDCVQECLETLHRNRHSYDSQRSFRPWFFTLVRHKTIDFLRRNRRRAVTLPENLAELSLDPRPGDALDAARVLTRLDPIYRQAIVLTKLGGYTTAEAATLLGVSSVAMRTRVHRGLRQLRHLLDTEVIT